MPADAARHQRVPQLMNRHGGQQDGPPHEGRPAHGRPAAKRLGQQRHHKKGGEGVVQADGDAKQAARPHRLCRHAVHRVCVGLACRRGRRGGNGRWWRWSEAAVAAVAAVTAVAAVREADMEQPRACVAAAPRQAAALTGRLWRAAELNWDLERGPRQGSGTCSLPLRAQGSDRLAWESRGEPAKRRRANHLRDFFPTPLRSWSASPTISAIPRRVPIVHRAAGKSQPRLAFLCRVSLARSPAPAWPLSLSKGRTLCMWQQAAAQQPAAWPPPPPADATASATAVRRQELRDFIRLRRTLLGKVGWLGW